MYAINGPKRLLRRILEINYKDSEPTNQPTNNYINVRSKADK